MMRVEDIKFFIRVAELGSISRAANECYISQQGLSRIISKFEKEIGVKLFIRSSKSIYLTSDGEVILKAAKEIEKAYVNMLDSAIGLNAKRSNDKMSYTIYATPLMCFSLLPSIIKKLTEQFPMYRFDIIERLGGEVLENVKFEENSIAICSIVYFLEEGCLRLESGDIIFEKYYSDNIQILVHEESPMASKSIITLDELSVTPLVIYGPQDEVLARTLLGDHFRSRLVTNTSNYVLCRTIIEQGFAAGFTTSLTEHYYRSSQTAYVPVDRNLAVNHGCIYSKEQHLGEVGREVRKIVRNELRLVSKAESLAANSIKEQRY